ncbi:MAG TPA: DUF3352 domain-containing protein, partial [Solirubrobacteraceae bacterium]|nr:DUF3352 domain-containing protein [Solirubrobacteraceae bacterium]
GCGSSSGSGHAESPLATELSYFPTDTPFVIAVTTNPSSSALKSAESQLTTRFPEGSLGIAALEEKLQSFGLNYDSDIKPLFGNPILLGAVSNTAVSAGAARDNYLFSWVASSASGLKSLVSKLTHAGGSTDTRDGASLYQLGDVTLAVDGATVLIGPPSVVNAALDTHAHNLGFTQAEYSSDTTGLPQNNLVEAFGNLTAVLSRPSAAKAREVPWVNAIRSYGAAISTSSSGITFQYRVNTNGSALSPSQVPIAAGSAAPDLVGTAPVSVGINDPAQIISFALAADQAVSPSSYAAFEARMAKLKSSEGIDLQTLTDLLTGSVIIEKDGSAAIGRATVSNPSEAASVLAKLASAPHGLFKSGTAFTKLGGGFYQIKEPASPVTGVAGKPTLLTLGVTGNQLVVGKATVAQEKAFAAAPSAPASFAHGSVAFQVALSSLLQSKLSGGGSTASAIAQTLLSHLGDLTGWVAASPSALTGSATLALH